MPRGRKPKLTPEVQEAVVQAVALGATHELAALYAKLSRDTVWRWLKRGEADLEGPYRAFALAVREAEAKSAAQCLALIRSAAKGSWQAAAWLLERRFGDHYGRTKVEVRTEGKVQHVHSERATFDYSKYTDQELKDLERLLSKQDEAPSAASGNDAPWAEGGEGETEPA